uniref:Transmembrane protein 8B n=1 Tax=Chrysemys picta bellii TaxID=8478 RepID=A0A8C3FF13_CHRPI
MNMPQSFGALVSLSLGESAPPVAPNGTQPPPAVPPPGERCWPIRPTLRNELDTFSVHFYIFFGPNVSVPPDRPAVFGISLLPVLDSGGVLNLELKLNVSSLRGENVTVFGCLTHEVPLMAGDNASITCETGEGSLTGFLLSVNSTASLARLRIPYPQTGSWYLSLRAVCGRFEPCANVTAEVYLRTYLSPCIDDCGPYGQCKLLRTNNYLYAACECKAGEGSQAPWHPRVVSAGCCPTDWLSPLLLVTGLQIPCLGQLWGCHGQHRTTTPSPAQPGSPPGRGLCCVMTITSPWHLGPGVGAAPSAGQGRQGRWEVPAALGGGVGAGKLDPQAGSAAPGCARAGGRSRAAPAGRAGSQLREGTLGVCRAGSPRAGAGTRPADTATEQPDDPARLGARWHHATGNPFALLRQHVRAPGTCCHPGLGLQKPRAGPHGAQLCLYQTWAAPGRFPKFSAMRGSRSPARGPCQSETEAWGG